jgi:sulfonate transport system substrate-binding protein
MATTELKDGSRLLYRNAEFPSYGVLNARENFLKESPDLVDQVLTCYQTARAWIGANPTEAAALLAKEASLETAVAEKVLTERTNVEISIVPGAAQKAVLEAVLPVFVAEGLVRSEEEARAALDTLYDTTFAEKAQK